MPCSGVPALGRQAKILVVDDFPETAALIARSLAWAGYYVIAVDSAEAALEACAAQQFDLLISDIRMPGKDGFQLLEELRSRNAVQRAVAISGVPIPGMHRKSQEAGFVEFLNKPIGLDGLRQTVQRALQTAE